MLLVEKQRSSRAQTPQASAPLHQYIEQTLAISGGGRGIKFEVANLDRLEQAPESVTRMGIGLLSVGWPPTMTLPMTLVTILDGYPTQIVDALRLPDHDKDEQTVQNLAIHLKFCLPLPKRVAIGNMVYHVRPHTLPVMHCTRCLLFGHGNISCNGRAHCRKCSGYHDTDGCVREDHCLFCGPSYHPTSKQCPPHIQAVQHDGAHSLLDFK
ncbi:hypothetical protein E2C01_075993 [Portunus trituberculatus]|uniref:Nucleic-acid-binding protein from mobile element jockey n=1 Tax=Portunus trituberculatus TaxID=210409 RepID=A0A5B7IA80_PORTR|nr:hypothetical protein [Portunus trituberculatus]